MSTHEYAKSLGMAKLKVRYTRSSGVAKAEAYMWYAEHFATRYDALDRTFCDAIKLSPAEFVVLGFLT
jgi:hypothetical protein